jgi:hypothetical protein
MENKGLLFIPDISGFTRFVNETEIEHSRMIIQELLEVLINANTIGLNISEVEGDAILFYKYGEAPDLKALYDQVEKMFCSFHRRLIEYDRRRFCQCAACKSAADLTLKVITHYGEFTSYNVKNFSKLIGKDIIVAHQLLKNDIHQHEYWLVTKTLLMDHDPDGPEQWIEWISSAKQTDSGEISFHYAPLTPLKETLPPDSSLQLELAKKTRVLSVSKTFDTDMITLFHATGDFHYRHLWQEGVKAIEEVDHFLPRVGMRCRCVMDSGEVVIYASSYFYHPERIEFSDTDEKKHSSTYFIIENAGDNRSKLTVDYYLKKNFADELLFNVVRKNKMVASLERSFLRLEDLVKEIKLPS